MQIGKGEIGRDCQGILERRIGLTWESHQKIGSKPQVRYFVIRLFDQRDVGLD